MNSKTWCFTRLPALAATLLLGSLTSACLDRPLCPGKGQTDEECAPRTTNVIVDTLTQNTVDKIDMLFVIDNSQSMGDKQSVLKEALPALVGRLVNPICINNTGMLQQNQPKTPGAACDKGFGREFKPITDINVGVVTSSLGDYGSSDGNCTPNGTAANEGRNDKGYLLGVLARGNAAIGSSVDTGPMYAGFLHWGPQSNEGVFEESFGKLVSSAEEFGCGYEGTLEAWFRFLVDPAPYSELVKRDMGGATVIGPKADAAGNIAPDTQILAQRAAFLRPDSLVAIVMLTDENDCSFRASGQPFYITSLTDTKGEILMVKGSKECETNPEDPCCYSCAANPPKTCDQNAAAHNCDGKGGPTYPSSQADDPTRDRPNLRCFKQKSRFGIDYLYSTKRYINALTKPQLCLDRSDLADTGACSALLANPLYAGGRSQSLVFLAGIIGVPWQDLAKDPNGPVLEYKKSVDGENPNDGLNWDWLLGPAAGRLGAEPKPDDALLHEQMEPRTGNSAQGGPLAADSSAEGANKINGHEWRADLSINGDLQYACIFKLPDDKQVTCPNEPATDTTMKNKNCDCTTAVNGDPKLHNPLCQSGGTYGPKQFYAKAYPGIRELQVLYGIGVEEDGITPKRSSNAIVASVCPKTLKAGDKDYGYNPAVSAIVDRLKEQLAEPCLPRSLSVVQTDTGPKVQCKIVEASKKMGACDPNEARENVVPAVDKAVREQLARSGRCGAAGLPGCETLQLCEITQITDKQDQTSCMTEGSPSGNGWCYVDALKLDEFGINGDLAAQAESLVERCPSSAKRKLRFLGKGQPASGTDTFFACTGAAF